MQQEKDWQAWIEEENREINQYTEGLNGLISAVETTQIEHLQYKFNYFLYIIHRRKLYMDKLKQELLSLSDAIEKDKAITEISDHIEDILASRDHLSRKRESLAKDIDDCRKLIADKRAELQELVQQSKRINHDSYELKL